MKIKLKVEIGDQTIELTEDEAIELRVAINKFTPISSWVPDYPLPTNKQYGKVTGPNSVDHSILNTAEIT